MADADGDGMADVMQITNDDPATPGNEEHLQVWHSNGDGTYPHVPRITQSPGLMRRRWRPACRLTSASASLSGSFP